MCSWNLPSKFRNKGNFLSSQATNTHAVSLQLLLFEPLTDTVRASVGSTLDFDVVSKNNAVSSIYTSTDSDTVKWQQPLRNFLFS